MWETCVWSLDWEAPLENGKATHSSILTWRIYMSYPCSVREAWHAAIHGVAKSWTRLSDWTELNWSMFYTVHGIHKKSDTTEWHSQEWLVKITGRKISIQRKERLSKGPVVQWLNPVWLCNPVDYSTPGFPFLYYLLGSAQTHVHCVNMPSNLLILCHSLLLLLSIFHSIRVFSNESTLCIRWPKYWSFSFSISPSNEYSGLISFRVHWFDLLTAQGILKCVLQHCSSKASIFLRSTFFMVQLSHPYMTTGKAIALTV